MESRYKVIISNQNIYKEVELASDCRQFKVGTDIDNDLRLRKELFFEPIQLVFIKKDEQWSIQCSDNVYISIGDVRKLISKQLSHGDAFEIKYQNSNNYVFSLSFFIDFESAQKKYERRIDISNQAKVSIGSSFENDIVINSRYTKNDAVELLRLNNGWELNIKASAYGVYTNGNQAESGHILKNKDFVSVSDFYFYLSNGELWTEIKENLKIMTLPYKDQTLADSYPKFMRSTRLQLQPCEDQIEILDPPAIPKKPKNNILMRVLPSLGMLAAAGVMAMYGGGMIIFSLISCGMALLTSIMGIKESNKEFKISSQERIDKYKNYVNKKKKEIEKYRSEERSALDEIYISQKIEENRFNVFSPNLFDRSEGDEDFLSIRIGSGDVISKRKINYKKQEKLEIEDDLQMIPENICHEYKYVHDAPIVCNLKDINALGIIGNAEYRFEFLKNIVIDLTARHYYTDLKLIFIAEKENKDRIYWLRMLPYVYNETLHIRNIVCNDESKNLIFEYLYKECTIREQNKTYENHIIAIFYDEYGFKAHPLSKFVDKAKELGITFIFFGEEEINVPQGCNNLVEIKDSKAANLIDTGNKEKVTLFQYPTIEFQKAIHIVNLTAPVYTEAISLEGSLTKNITLFELLNIFTVEDIDLAQRWSKAEVFKSMAAPIGVSKTSVIELNLHDKAHGPHGLVAGTTGSGKSEILQTYILSMATLFHPYEVGFVIIDFKGGGMVNQFKTLPHLMGAITNIDGKEIDRSLKSIKSELQKRQRLFADAEVNHIDKYIRKYKNNEVKEPLPHLIIIVDEFAELKAEQPEFMKELISAARIGRSLGVHLILATQKPSGQVDDQIWSNSRFKLCLKVQDQQDSNEVIKSPLAAEIKEPGRAYLQVGNNEIFELFQSAYSGAPEKNDDTKVKEFTIFQLTDTGKRIPVYEQKKKKNNGENKTQLESIVEYVYKYTKEANIIKLPDICLPSLKKIIDFPSQSVLMDHEEGITIEIGMFDDPEHQFQGVYSVNITENNLMIIGSSQSGKTNVLQNIIRCLSMKYTPDEVNIYIIDFASMVLKNFEKLNHVGGVVCASDDEKLKNLFKLLYAEIDKRKEKLVSVGVSSYSAYKEAGESDIPFIVLMIDNLTALKELYFQDDDRLLNICREGLSVGICVIIANSQTAGIGYKYLANFSSRIALFCNDSGEYSALFDHCSERIENTPGRCLIKADNKHLDCQAYLAFRGEKEIERVQNIKAYIEKCNESNKYTAARMIPLIPASLTKSYMVDQFTPLMQNRFCIIGGLDYGDVTPYVFNFSSMGLLAVSGRENAGRHNWIKYSIDMLETMYPKQSNIFVIDGISKRLQSLKTYGNVISYSLIAEDSIEFIKDIEDELKERYDALVEGNENILNTSKLLLMVIDNQDAINAISSNSEALNAYKNITGKYKNLNVGIIVFVENANIPYSAPDLFKDVRNQHHFMYFDDISNLKLIDVPLSVSRNFKKQIEIGDGYYFKGNDVVKLKTPICVKR